MDLENNFDNEKQDINNFINFFIQITFFYYIVMICNFLNGNVFNGNDLNGNVGINFNNFFNSCMNFIIKFEKKLSKKLLIYNGISDSDFYDSSSDSDSESSSSTSSTSSTSSSTSTSTSSEKPEIKYEDKYLDDVKKMSDEYVFSWAETKLMCDKFNEFFNIHKITLVNEKHNLNQEILEKSVKYISVDDEEEDSEKGDDILNEYYDIKKNEIRKEERKKVIELEIGDLHAKLKEVEAMSDGFLIIANAKLDARNFVIKERLDGLKNNFILEKTPLGNVIMYYNNSRESFEYYSDNTIPYRFLETVGRKYVKTFNCKQIYFDMEFELKEFERKQKEGQKKILEDQKILEDSLKANTNTNTNTNVDLVKKKDVFAKFKDYNTESGTGKVNRGVAPPKNSIPNNTMKKNDNFILKDNANRYTCEGKLANFSFLKKPDRKIVDKKYAMSFADFKKMKK
jgi:hypothetical protein